MSGSLQNARQVAYDRLVKRVDRFQPRNDTASVFKEISQYLLEVNPVDGTHNKSGIEMDISAMMPAQHLVFTRENLDRGGYGLVLLREVSNFYTAFELSSGVIEQVDVSLRSNPTLMAYLWLAAVYDSNPNVGKLIIAFRESRDSRPPFEAAPSPVSAPVLARRITATVAAENHGPDTAASAAPNRLLNSDSNSPNRISPQTRSPAGAGQQTLTWDPALQTPLISRYPTTESSKKATSVSMYFRDSRFSGERSQCIRHTLRNYEVCSHQFELSGEQKKKFFVNIFSGLARDFSSKILTRICSTRNWLR